MCAAMALRAGAMDHALRRAAGDGHVPANPQMIGSGFIAKDGFHPARETVRGQAQSPDRSPGQWHPGGCRGDAPDGHDGRLAARIQGLDCAGGSAAPAA
jgi:hypothetical protein